MWLDLRLFSRHWLRDAQLSKAVMSSSSCVLTYHHRIASCPPKSGTIQNILRDRCQSSFFFALSCATKAEVDADNMGSRLLRRPAERSQNTRFMLENRSPSPLRLSSRVTRPLNIPVEVSGPLNFQTLLFQSWHLDLIQIWNTWSFLHQFLSNFGPIPCLLAIMLMKHFRLPFEVCHLPQQGVIFG